MNFQPIPLVWYRQTYPGELGEYERESMEQKTYTRCQVTAKFLDEGVLKVLIARMIVDGFQDFCGGFVVRSPQVFIRQPGRWQGNYFFDAGVSSREDSLTWDSINNGTFPAVDLNFLTGEDSIRSSQAEDWGWKQLAVSVAHHAMWTSKRMFHANGPDDSSISRLMDALTMLSRDRVPAPTPVITVNGTIGGPGHDAYAYMPSYYNYKDTRHWSVDITCTPDFRNYNSGARCIGWTGIFEWNRSDYDEDMCDCEECLMDRDNGSQKIEGEPIPSSVIEHLKRCYSSTFYTRALTRPLWRNG